ncbi:hypothetical protein Bbelb_428760 [Branchiostoma belcheri]|nr:hypothetical protein Bbelb_428760 [Branchiostoma belcheri]
MGSSVLLNAQCITFSTPPAALCRAPSTLVVMPHVSRPNADVIPPEAPCSRNEPFYCSFRDVTSETRECSRGSYVSDNLYRPLSLLSVGRLARMCTASFTPLAKKSDDFRVDCELCRHWGLNRRTGAKQNCAGGVEERRGRSRFFAGAKQNGAGAKQNGGGEEEGVSWGCLTKTTTECSLAANMLSPVQNRALATCNTHLVQPQSRQCGLRMAADGLAFACCLSRHTPGLFQNSRDFLRFPTTTYLIVTTQLSHNTFYTS